MTADEFLKDVEAREKAATPGPWEISEYPEEVGPCCVEGPGCTIFPYAENERGELSVPNATFAAAARSDIPKLVAMVRRLLAKAGRIRSASEKGSVAYEQADLAIVEADRIAEGK